jgi:two-component system OmpR family response regulator
MAGIYASWQKGTGAALSAGSQVPHRIWWQHRAVSGERLLLVDDEDNLRSMLEAALRHNGFDVTSVADGRAALAAAQAGDGTAPPDAIVLDVMLPDLDGFEVCRRLRAEGSRTPVLFLTARDATEDKVRGLTLGGDDYLVKPFSLEELVARVHAVLRRAGLTRNDDSVLRCADLELDDDAHRVTRGGADVSLSPTEYKLLRYLLLNQGRVLSKAQILDHVWQYDFGGDGGVVETYIGYLRRKVDNAEPRLIHTIRGVGYTLRQEG